VHLDLSSGVGIASHERSAARVLDGLRERLERLFAEPGRLDERAYAEQLRVALLETRVGLGQMRQGAEATERELTAERKQLADAVRRGQLAAQVPDAETVAVAQRFVAKHQERIGVLERKLAVQRDELGIAERELEELAQRLRSGGQTEVEARLRAAWRDVEAAGGVRPETDLANELARAQADRRLMEAAVEQQLAHLKRKLGKE
jgi:hypothetical protein